MALFDLTAEQKDIRNAAREFARGEFPDRAREADATEGCPRELYPMAADLGFQGLFFPEEYGGAGLGYLEFCLVCEEFWRVDPGLGQSLGSVTFGADLLLLYGTEEQKQRTLPPLTAGKAIMGAAITEADAGSDITGVRTTAVLDGDEWVLNGTKMFITNGTLANFLIVYCLTEPHAPSRHQRHSCILVETDRPGYAATKLRGKLGIRASDTAEVVLDQVRVPADNLIGTRGQGFQQFMEFFNRTRLHVAAQGVGVAQGALDKAVRHVKSREQFGKPLAALQGVQFKIAEMATRLEAARGLVYRAAAQVDAGTVDHQLIAMAKWFAGETGVRVTDEALQLHGGYGYLAEYDVERFYRDAKIVEIYEGTKEVEKQIVARTILGEDMTKLRDIDGVPLTERHELTACLQCGRCTGGCPMGLRSPLNARQLLYETTIREDGDALLDREEVWDCTACRTCADRCPRGLEPVQVLRDIRTLKIEGGRIPQSVMDALESSLKHGNPWGRSRMKRTAWAEEEEVRSLEEDHESQRLWFVGCTPAYDPRCQDVARALARVFNAAELDYTTLGTEEVCCGSELLRLGELGLFEELSETNRENFRELGFTEIVTTSPHCMNTFRSDYGLELPIQHYSQLLAGLAAEGKIPFGPGIPKKVVFHDPCYLGKQNDIYDAPREVIDAVPGVERVEFDRSRERSLCCEGGGGRMWLEGMGEGERNAQIRVRDAAALGADAVVTACPFCLLTLEDARKTACLEETLEIIDLAELVERALGPQPGS